MNKQLKNAQEFFQAVSQLIKDEKPQGERLERMLKMQREALNRLNQLRNE